MKKVATSPKIVVRRLHIAAGSARATPPVGPVLSELKVNIKAFCEDFNAATKGLSGPLPVNISVAPGGKYTYKFNKETMTHLIKKEFNILKGSKSPKRDPILTINFEQLRPIARHKVADLTCVNEDAAMNTVLGTAISMGIKVNNIK